MPIEEEEESIGAGKQAEEDASAAEWEDLEYAAENDEFGRSANPRRQSERRKAGAKEKGQIPSGNSGTESEDQRE